VQHAAGSWYSPTGHLLYTSRDGGLFAAKFDVNRLALTSGAVSVVPGVDPLRFAMSASGALLYTTDETSRTQTQPVWVTREGHASLYDSTWIGHFEYPALSPDGRSLAISVRDRTTDLWIQRADGTRLKVPAPGALNWRASWTTDGRSLAFVSVGDLAKNAQDIAVYTAPADGSAKASLLWRHTFGLWETELSRDGTWIVARADEMGGDSRIRARRLTGDTALVGVIDDPALKQVYSISLSPDGRWLAYASTESAMQPDVYVTPFPGAHTRFQVSRGGGNPGSPTTLFSLAGYRRARNRQQYDVSPDAQRFIMIREQSGTANRGVVYVENWLTELRAKVKK
jgi:Tol biopolymer transport system component